MNQMTKLIIKLIEQDTKKLSPKRQVDLLRHTCSITHKGETNTYDEWVKLLRPFGYSTMIKKSKEQALKTIGVTHSHLEQEVVRQLGELINV